MTNCPACGAPLMIHSDTEGVVCNYCHHVYFPGEDDAKDGVEVSGKPSDLWLDCPVCIIPLVQASLEKTDILYCPRCRGMLMRMEVVEGIIEELRTNQDRADAVQAPADRDELKRVLQCPKCNRSMDTHRYAGPGNVVVDTCDNCSFIWFDRGEINRIAHAPGEETVQRTYGF